MRTLAGVVACLAACTPLSMQIQSGQRPGTNFSGYADYAWTTAAARSPEWPAKNDRAAMDWQLRSLIDQQMAKRGYALVGNDGADLLIDYRIQRREVEMQDSFSDYAQYRAAGGEAGPGEAWVEGYEQGTLIVEVSDGRTRQLVWYGSASAVVNPKLREKRLPVAVERIFEQFPGRRAAGG
jgi:hypothetical protein